VARPLRPLITSEQDAGGFVTQTGGTPAHLVSDRTAPTALRRGRPARDVRVRCRRTARRLRASWNAWRNVAAEIRGTRLTVEVSADRLRDAVATQTRTLPAVAARAGKVDRYVKLVHSVLPLSHTGGKVTHVTEFGKEGARPTTTPTPSATNTRCGPPRARTGGTGPGPACGRWPTSSRSGSAWSP
jgi:hypothetical protein